MQVIAISPASKFEDASPRQDATARLLLLLAKPELHESLEDTARQLASQVKDWDEFAHIAANKFVVTLAQRHLQAHAADIVPLPAMARMRALARSATMSTLRAAAALVAFHKRCIEPTKASHAYIKGHALSQQHSQPIGDRYCRDIDVLIAPKDFRFVMNVALASGYRVHSDTMGFIDNSRDLEFLCRYADVLTLIGPDSVPIEVHRRLDKLSLNFDVKRALANAENVRIPGVTISVLSKPLHFVYVCYHHSRHFWSHLHWVADLDTMMRSPGYDLQQIRQVAESIGIRPTIDAAIEFHDLVSRPELWGANVPTETGGGQFLNACLVNLDGGPDIEKHLRQQMTLGDFMVAWQISPGRRNGLWLNSWIRRLRPTPTQYFAHKYPGYLRWIYSLENVMELGRNGFLQSINSTRRSAAAFVGRLLPQPKSAIKPGSK